MEIFFFLILLLGVALIITFLHKLRQKEALENLDRSDPLDSADDIEFNLPTENDVESFELTTESLHVSEHSPEEATGISKAEDALVNETSIKEDGIEEALTEEIPKTLNWLQEAKLFRDKNQFDDSLSLCLEQLPKIQAFKQLLITYRALIKQQLAKKQDAAQTLEDLYRVAVVADLYRSETTFLDEHPNAEFARKLLRTLKTDYLQTGYAELSTLIKSDIKLLIQTWGEPQQHTHANHLDYSTSDESRSSL